MRRLLPLLLLCAAAVPAAAQIRVVSQKPDHVAVAIYHEGTVDTAALSRTTSSRGQGLAMITESRTIDVPAGPSLIQFRGVAATLVPQTADVSGLPGGVIERNFDFNLLTPGALMEKSVGQSVHLVRTDPRTGAQTRQDAILRSGPDGVVLQTGGGYEALDCSGLPERIVFDRVPDGLTDTPTLTVRANAPRAGRVTIILRYIATGLNWSADYVARIAPDDRTLDLSGWITLANVSETGFADAPVDVIAGHVQTTGNDTPPRITSVGRSTACWPTSIDWNSYIKLATPLFRAIMAAPPPMAMMMAANTVTVTGTSIAARDLGDYKLYALPEPTSVAARQTKQVQFLDQKAVPFARVWRVSIGPGDITSNSLRPASVLLRLRNSEQGHLGKPLPAGGIVAMADTADHVSMVTGEDRIADIPVGAPVEIADGHTIEVFARTQLIAQTIVKGRTRDTLEVTVTNNKTVPVAFEWRQMADRAQVISESRDHAARDGGWVWSIALAPGAQDIFRYTFEQG